MPDIFRGLIELLPLGIIVGALVLWSRARRRAWERVHGKGYSRSNSALTSRGSNASRGKFLIGIGIIGVLISISMDTSVDSGVGRVNNLGLIKDQQNYLLIALAVIGVGIAFYLKGDKPQ